MGDSADTGVLWLVVPGILALFFGIANLVLMGIFLKDGFRSQWKLLIHTSLAESALPLAALFLEGAFLNLFRIVAPEVVEQRSVRISVFLLLLYIGGLAVNYFVFFQNHDKSKSEAQIQYSDLVYSSMLGIVPPLIFSGMWVLLGKILNTLG
jgi:hypothetical protein